MTGPGGGPASFEATMAHIEMLVRKRERLNDAIGDAYDALLVAVARENLPPEAAVEVYERVRGFRSRFSSPAPHSPAMRMVDALGYGMGDLTRWSKDRRNLPRISTYCEGEFPVGYTWLPAKGQPCVYALLVGETVVYVGSSANVKARLRAHWHERKKPGINNWRVYQCGADEEKLDLERKLICDLSPRYNVAGNRFPSVA